MIIARTRYSLLSDGWSLNVFTLCDLKGVQFFADVIVRFYFVFQESELCCFYVELRKTSRLQCFQLMEDPWINT